MAVRHIDANKWKLNAFYTNNMHAYFLMELPSLLIRIIKNYELAILVMSEKLIDGTPPFSRTGVVGH